MRTIVRVTRLPVFANHNPSAPTLKLPGSALWYLAGPPTVCATEPNDENPLLIFTWCALVPDDFAEPAEEPARRPGHTCEDNEDPCEGCDDERDRAVAEQLEAEAKSEARKLQAKISSHLQQWADNLSELPGSSFDKTIIRVAEEMDALRREVDGPDFSDVDP